MTLLETITKSAAAGDLSPSPSLFPIISDTKQIILQSSSQIPVGSQTLIQPVSGWAIPMLDSDLNSLSSDLAFSLKSRLKNPNKNPTFTRSDLLSLLNSFFNKASFKVGATVPSGPYFTLAAIDHLGFLLSRDVSNLIAESCLLFDLWDVLRSLILKGVVGNLNSFSLVEKLVEKNQVELVCLCVRKIQNLRGSEVYAMLNFFLSPNEGCFDEMVRVRKEWEREAMFAIGKVRESGLPKKVANLAKDVAVLLMLAHDGFCSNEICLHYVFGSENFDGVVLGSAVERLDGGQVVGLVRYFLKWLEKYERFPEVRGCKSSGGVLELSCCECVPSLEDVVRGLRLVFDVHFSYLVLNTEFREELKKAEVVVRELAMEADLCCPVDDVVKRLKESRKHQGVW